MQQHNFDVLIHEVEEIFNMSKKEEVVGAFSF
jgi:hypothetical protein